MKNKKILFIAIFAICFLAVSSCFGGNKKSNGYECWSEYDNNGNEIHSKDSTGYESWHEYDSNGNEIYYKNSDGDEWWFDYDYYGDGNPKNVYIMTVAD